jgi:hypothetical protein
MDHMLLLVMVVTCFLGGLSVLVYSSQTIRSQKEWMELQARREDQRRQREQMAEKIPVAGASDES